MEEITIIFSTNDRYVHHTAVALLSLLTNTKQANKIHSWILANQLSTENRKYLSELIQSFGAKVDFKSVSIPNDLYISGHVTIEAYFRIAIGSILPAKIDHAIYLDSDLIVLDDIDKLWALRLNNKIVGAVEKPEGRGSEQLPEMSCNHIYFNSGVILFNLSRWKSENLEDRTISYARIYSSLLHMWDQDALNATLQNEVMYLPLRWNVQTQVIYGNHSYATATSKEVTLAQNDPGIVHFTTSNKPWHYLNSHPYRDYYFYFLNLTPWKGREPSDGNLYKWIRKQLRPFRRVTRERK